MDEQDKQDGKEKSENRMGAEGSTRSEGTGRKRSLSTLTEWSKNVRKRKKRKVDRGFWGVARGEGLHGFVCKARSPEDVRRRDRHHRDRTNHESSFPHGVAPSWLRT
jgi:hypothetical protein